MSWTLADLIWENLEEPELEDDVYYNDVVHKVEELSVTHYITIANEQLELTSDLTYIINDKKEVISEVDYFTLDTNILTFEETMSDHNTYLLRTLIDKLK